MHATLVAALLTGGTAAVHPQRSLPRVGCTTAITPFASAAACKGDECIKEKRRTFERAGRTLVVDQEFSTAKQRSTGAGVWECGELLSAKLAAEPGLCKGKTVLELGAGCGLVAMTAAICGATRVVASDGDEGSCAHLEDILAANGLQKAVVAHSSPSTKILLAHKRRQP